MILNGIKMGTGLAYQCVFHPNIKGRFPLLTIRDETAIICRTIHLFRENIHRIWRSIPISKYSKKICQICKSPSKTSEADLFPRVVTKTHLFSRVVTIALAPLQRAALVALDRVRRSRWHLGFRFLFLFLILVFCF